MLALYISVFDYVYNNIFYFYYIYTLIYKLTILLKFNMQYKFNILKYYITLNKLIYKILRYFLFIYYYIKRIFLWINRRFLKKRKRFRIYYKFHNIRYWKFLLFLFYINVFFIIWKKRNLYRTSQFILILIFLHIGILILLHFFLSLFDSFDIAMLSCLLFFSILLMFFKR